MATRSALHEAIRNVSADPNRIRIKKLLVYACRHTWENSPEALERIPWDEVLEDVLAIAPSAEQLEFYLNSVVQTINKRAEYSLIAKSTTQHLKPLYHVPTPTLPLQKAPTNRYQSVARLLDQDPDSMRIKKLLYCACKHVWENEPRKLNYFQSASLVEELHHQTQTVENLHSVLWSIVRTLNRSDVYQAIAEKILAAFQLLYQHAETTQTHWVTGVQGVATEASSKLFTGVLPSAVQHHTPPPPPPPIAPVAPVIEVAAPPEEEPAAPPPAKPLADWLADLFDLRLEIMKYTTPLRAKALLHGVLHPSTHDEEQIWAILRSTEIDELLRLVVQTYRVFAELERKLTDNAKAMPDSALYRQTAQTLIRLLKPAYSGAIAGLSLTTDSVPPITRSTRDGTTSERLDRSAPVYDHDTVGDSQETCQFSHLSNVPLHEETAAANPVPPPASPATPTSMQDYTLPLSPN